MVSESGSGYPDFSKAIQFQIGELKFGENPAEVQPVAEPNPIKISWSRTNRVKVHEIPYPKDKTIRTSLKSLYTCRVELHTLKPKTFTDLLEMCEQTGPWKIITATLPPMYMYIVQYGFDQSAGNGDQYISWNLELQEVND